MKEWAKKWVCEKKGERNDIEGCGRDRMVLERWWKKWRFERYQTYEGF